MTRTVPARSSRSIASARSSQPAPARGKAKPLPPLVAGTLAQLLPLGPVEARRLFSGHGLYLDGTIFALTYHDRLYFRVDGESRAAFLKAGGQPFTYQGTHRVVELPYCTPPESALKGAAKLLVWAERGLAAARRVALEKAKKKGPRERTPLPAKRRRAEEGD